MALVIALTTVAGTCLTAAAAYIIRRRRHLHTKFSCDEDHCICSVETTRHVTLDVLQREHADALNTIREQADELADINALMLDRDEEIRKLTATIEGIQRDYTEVRKQVLRQQHAPNPHIPPRLFMDHDSHSARSAPITP